MVRITQSEHRLENKRDQVSTILRIYSQAFNHFATSIAWGRTQGTNVCIRSISETFNTVKEESTTQLPKKYYHYVDVFDKVKSSILPHHWLYDCPIDLQLGKEPPWRPIYNLSPTALEVLRAYIEENLANGFIEHSKSPVGAPIFFVKKKDGSLRLVVDYRGWIKSPSGIGIHFPWSRVF